MQKEYKVYFSGRNYTGEGIYNIEDGTLKLMKGSKIAKNETDSFRKYYSHAANIKDELIDQGLIVDNELTQDHLFQLPYHASAILSTTGIAGNRAWKTSEGKNIEQIIQSQTSIEVFKEYFKNFQLDVDRGQIKCQAAL